MVGLERCENKGTSIPDTKKPSRRKAKLFFIERYYLVGMSVKVPVTCAGVPGKVTSNVPLALPPLLLVTTTEPPVAML